MRVAAKDVLRPEKFSIDPESIADLQKKLIEAGPASVLSFFALEILFTNVDSQRLWLSVEHPTWLLVTSQHPWSVEEYATTEQYLRIDSLVDQHIGKTHGRLMGQHVHASGSDVKLQRLIIDATIHHLNVRKLVFRFQARHEVSALFGPIAAELRSIVGFDISDVLAVEQGISSLITTRGDAWSKQRVDFLSRLRAALDGHASRLSAEESGWLVRSRELYTEREDIRQDLALQWCLSSAASIFLASTAEIAAAANTSEPITRAVLTRFSLRRPQPVIASSEPSIYEPLELHPLVQVDDDRWLFHLASPKLNDSIRGNLEKAIKQHRVWERYQKGRAAYVETRTVDLLAKLSPHAKGWVGLKYSFDDGSGRQQYELDGLVLVDGVAFLVEGKAGSVRFNARRGDPQATVSNLKSLAVDAHNQALRARRFLSSTPNAEFSVDGQTINVDSRVIREFVLVTTTLEVLSGFLTRSYDLVQSGLLSPGQLPWAVALPELELICDLVEGVGQLVQYVRRRLALGTRDISTAEELDWFGNYLHEGLFFDGADYAKLDGLYVGDFAQPINAYYEAVHDSRLPVAPKPQQDIPPEIRSLIDDLESAGPAGFIEAVTSLLDGDGAARTRLARGINEAKQTANAKGFGGFRLKMAAAMVVVSFHDYEPTPERLVAYVKAAKYDARVARCVGIAQSTKVRTQLLVAVEHGPFSESEEGARQCRQFLAELKTAEERPER